MTSFTKSIAFLFIGGPHQVFHTAPVAAEMALREPNARIVIYCADQHQQSLVSRVLSVYKVDWVEVVRLNAPKWLCWALSSVRKASAIKLPLLFQYRRMLDRFDAIVVPERTSAWLRSMGVAHPKLIHMRHGAGDRAPSSEKRLDAFDFIVVPGEKDIRRAMNTGLVSRDRLAISGYVKFDLVRRLQAGSATRLFDNGRPTVLYNPHFDPKVSSWGRDARAVIEAFRAQDRYNLVVAPHCRLFENASEAERAEWEALAEPGKIIVDLGSDKSIDMTYTIGADLYLGDASSQVYEFIIRPRPCLFLDAHGADWQDNPKFACWHLGEVLRDPREIIAAVQRAFEDPMAHAPRQRAALVDAVGDNFDGAAKRGAGAVLDYLRRRAA